jgi:nucleotide-binding universal stress UspA family protein
LNKSAQPKQFTMKVRTSRRSRRVVLEMGPRDSSLPPIPVPELQIKRILIPVDFSDCSHKAFHYAAHFARQFNAELMLLHVVVLIPPAPMVILDTERLAVEYGEQAAKQLSEWRKEVSPGISVKAVTRNGAEAHQEIVEAARDSNSDLIIIGNHGRTGVSRFLTGGTTERVVRYAPCPVLVIREREHDFVTEDKLGPAETQPATAPRRARSA